MNPEAALNLLTRFTDQQTAEPLEVQQRTETAMKVTALLFIALNSICSANLLQPETASAGGKSARHTTDVWSHDGFAYIGTFNGQSAKSRHAGPAVQQPSRPKPPDTFPSMIMKEGDIMGDVPGKAR